ncbi:hypothetical protein ACH35V_07345 [Actinomadura sp. 1N219]|uniref:hypothetical protein n=1 Tax=Actinomadura sp. 1N219 TaxID=3375152 RepID=UPI0037BB5489
MNEKPEKAESETTGQDREKRPPAKDKPQPQPKKKPGDAARKMREMFKGQPPAASGRPPAAPGRSAAGPGAGPGG